MPDQTSLKFHLPKEIGQLLLSILEYICLICNSEKYIACVFYLKRCKNLQLLSVTSSQKLLRSQYGIMSHQLHRFESYLYTVKSFLFVESMFRCRKNFHGLLECNFVVISIILINLKNAHIYMIIIYEEINL